MFHATTQFMIYDRATAMVPDSIVFFSSLTDSSTKEALHKITRESVNSTACQQYYQHTHEEAYYPPFIVPADNVTKCFPRVPEPGERSIRSAVN